MASDTLTSIDDYDRFLDATLKAWTPERRVALAAAMAERWFPAYEAFSAAEGWGEPAALRRALDAVWGHLRGHTLSKAECARLDAAVTAVTPHMDDFEAYEALAATAAVSNALKSCLTANNVTDASQATISGFHAVEPEWDNDPDDDARLWRRPAIRKELLKQTRVIERVGAVERFDERSVDALRASLTQSDVVGQIPRAPEKKGPPTYPNAVIFDGHRRHMESSLKRPVEVSQWVSVEMMTYLTWASRYSSRFRTLSSQESRLADLRAQLALVARNRMRDAAVRDVPSWDPELRQYIDMSMRNMPSGWFEVRSLELPHSYGPSMRRLWAEAKREGKSDADAWRHILAWAQHRPAAWDRDGALKRKKGKAEWEAAVGRHLAHDVAWRDTDDPDHPWAADVDGARWQVRLNDFPDDFMYSLLVDGVVAGDFHDWPKCWQRE